MSLAVVAPELLTCSVCGETYAWRGVGRMPGRCPSCRARRSGRTIAEPGTAGRESQHQAEEEAAIDVWARRRAAEIKRRVRQTA